jgi:hypothetical protein
MGFSFVYSICFVFCSQKNRDLTATSFIRQRWQRHDFTDHQRACGFNYRPFDKRKPQSLGGMGTNVNWLLSLPTMYVLRKHILTILVPGCRFYEQRESEIPKNPK